MSIGSEQPLKLKVVITGATGFIGVHLIEALLKKDVDIVAIVRPNSKNISRLLKYQGISIIELEMDEYSKIPDYVDSADIFYHLAWEGARIPLRDDTKVQKKNYSCTLDVYKAVKQLGCKSMIVTGSQAEYGINSEIISERHHCNPVTEYGRYKLKAYEELEKLSQGDGIKLVWTRIFSLYGVYDYSGSLVMTAIEKMRKNETVEMTACTQLWDYLYVDDAAEALVMLALCDVESGIYNLANGEHRELRFFVSEIKRVLNSESDLQFGTLPYGEKGPVNLMPDSSKLKSLGWKPKTSFEEGIREIISFNKKSQ